MAECSCRAWSAPAVREVQWIRREDAAQHPGHHIGAELCEEDAAEIGSTLRMADACLWFVDYSAEFNGHDIETGAPRRDEAQLCAEHWGVLLNARTWTLNGITMVHDGSANARALPPDVGHARPQPG